MLAFREAEKAGQIVIIHDETLDRTTTGAVIGNFPGVPKAWLKAQG